MSAVPAPSCGWGKARRMFGSSLGIIFFCAFGSLAMQARGLFGAHGIAPVRDFLNAVQTQLGSHAAWKVPSVFWLNSSDGFMVAIATVGAAISLVLAAGFAPGACALLCWILYLSFCAVGSPFLNFQWDALLLETALLAVFHLPWSLRPDWRRESPAARIARWLLWWLLFRLMFESGVVKLSSGDPTWRGLSALDYHFETQPLPLWTAWFAHQLPGWMLRATTAGVLLVELVVPFLIFAPRRFRHLAGVALIALQLAIAATGNYAFFNLLTIALCLLLFDNGAWRKLGALVRWRKLEREVPDPSGSKAAAARWPGRLFMPVAALVLVLTALPLIGCFRTAWRPPEFLAALQRAFAPLESFNGYGLFAVMTTTRPEIVVEGSVDGTNWQAYGLRWKPGDLRAPPRLAAPHQPRLDWQMWFAALGEVRQNPWFINFLARLLKGSPEVLNLLAWNPFPRQPPRYVRAVLYDYHFTHFGERGWWRREEKGLYCPTLSLQQDAP